jgi:AcrR family transcriptional regulator
MPKDAAHMPDRFAASAFALFSRHGIKNVSLDQVAAHAGVTKGSLYWHFKSKDEVILAASAHYYAAYHRRINEGLARVTDPAKRLARTVETAVQICLTDHANRVFTTEIFTLAITNDKLRRSWRQFSDTVRDFYINLVKAAAAAGRLKTHDPERAVDFMLSAMEGIKLRALYEPHLCAPDHAEETCAQLKQILGLSADN